MSEFTEKTMQKIRDLVAQSGKTQDEIGQKMGYKPESARKSVSQFLKSTTDPRLEMLEKVAIALDTTVAELLAE
jgi:transcriptional regulator with XRE-family HTH domain